MKLNKPFSVKILILGFFLMASVHTVTNCQEKDDLLFLLTESKNKQQTISQMPYYLRTRVNLLDHFISRFNCQSNIYSEDIGEELQRIIQHTPDFKNSTKFKTIRKEYISVLIDDSLLLSSDSIFYYDFISKVVDDGIYLNYINNHWYASLPLEVKYENASLEIMCLMKPIKARIGYKWVFCDIVLPPSLKGGQQKEDEVFIQPMSHEIGFINILDILDKKNQIRYLFDDTFSYDDRHTFFSMIDSGETEVIRTGKVSYFFFCVPEYVFRVQYIDYQNNKSGWLIDSIKEKDGSESPLQYLKSTLEKK